MTDLTNIECKESAGRKLATIRRIDEIKAHPNADALDLAVIGGWQLVTAKANGFKTGDMVVYLEVDSWVPTEIAAFLSKGKEPREFEGVKGERLRSIKLRGELSQGLILPIDDTLRAEMNTALANVHSDSYPEWVPEEGEDLTELLGIKKYEKPIPAALAGLAAGNFPSFIRKTDQERCQNLVREIFGYEDVKFEIEGLTPEVARESNARGIEEGRIVIEGDKVFSLRAATASPDDEYEVTMKMDGSSFTAFVNDDEVGVCSRNLQLKTTAENAGNSFVQMLFAAKLDEILPKLREDLGFNLAIQGELMGPGIQGNQEKLTSPVLFVFEMQDIDGQRNLTVAERNQVFKFIEEAGAGSVIQHAPVLHERVTLGELGITHIGDLLKFAEGPSLVAKQREGLVFKRVDGKFSFKAISNKWLLDNE